MSAKYLAFDLGASSGRAILGKLSDDDKLVISEVHRFPNVMVEAGDHLHWDSRRLLAEIHEGMRRCGKHTFSIGIDTWGVDYALLRAGGKLLGLPYAYRDRRTDGAVEGFVAKMPRERLYERTGIQILPFDTLFQLYAALRDEPQTLRSASSLLMMADLFNYQLTGVAVSEFTLATTTHLYNPWEDKWDEEIISTLGITRGLFQEIVEPGTILGELTPETRSETGLGKLPVIAVACHDTGSAIAASPAEGEDFAYISSGTWSLMGIESQTPIINDASQRYNITNEGGIAHTYRVLKNIAGLWLLQECRRVWERESSYRYDELVALAEAAEPYKAVIDPDWCGFVNPPSMPEAIVAYCKKTGQNPPHTYGETIRVILESLALAYRHTLAQLEEASGRNIRRIHIVGGGSQNQLLSRLAADATGKRVYAGPAEATAIGNVLVQAMAGGRVRDLPHIRRIVRGSTEITEYEPCGPGEWDEAYMKFIKIKERIV
ncbi:MAG: rhamnulokinase [Candidatus Bathyarchaeota archaeon]|nr:rhamnulokinase [Candidatus Bathyarchaeota archaeon]